MDILFQLGVNKTYFIQFAIFVFALLVLTQFVFKDFVQLLEKREHQTKGSENIANEEQKKSAEMHRAFEEKARGISGQIKTIFDTYRSEANQEFEKIISKARGESNQLIEESRKKVNLEINDAAKKLALEAPEVAKAMTSKLLSKGSTGRSL